MEEFARQFITDYGYLAVFVGTFLEGEVILLTAGFAASQGLLAAPVVAGVAAAGAYAGHVVFFSIGRWKGAGWLFGHPRLGLPARKADRVIIRYGWSSVFILQYLYGARIAGAILFGISSFTVPRFLVLQIANCITWAALVTGLGYAFGAALETAHARLAWISAAAVVLIGGATFLYTWLQRRRGRRQGRETGPSP